MTISPEVFKIKDPRVEALKSGRMSAEAFADMVGPGDPFAVVDGTVHALSEEEFYASRAVMPVNAMSEAEFRRILDMEDLSFMHKLDRDFVDQVRRDLPTCPACRYKRYKDEVYKLARKYGIGGTAKVSLKDADILADKAEYPQVTEPVTPVVSLLVRHMFRTTLPERVPCIDCVEKHVAQAYILAGETMCGYPEHLILVIGHLGEALDELPPEFDALRRTLMFCLARCKRDGKPFVPIHLLLPLINLARAELNQRMEDQSDDVSGSVPEDLELDFTQAMMDELVILPTSMLERLSRLLSMADSAAKEGADRASWEGSVASAGEGVAKMCPKTAAMLRNRRLLFIGDIAAATGDWSFERVTDYLERVCSARTN